MKRVKKIKKGAPKWTVTFADLSTLLLTFFVLMLSFANIDIQAFKELLGSVQEAFGVQKKERGEYQAVLKEKIESVAKVDEEEAKKVDEKRKERQAQKMSQELDETIEENDLEEDTKVIAGSDSVRVRITGQLMFSPGKAKLKKDSLRLLNGIANAMKNSDYYLLVEGHTDSLNISTEQFPSNWELSGARAAAVVRYLIKQGISLKRLSGIGYAYNYPLATNKTAQGRNLNRRVEFIFTQTPLRSVLEDEYDEDDEGEGEGEDDYDL